MGILSFKRPVGVATLAIAAALSLTGCGGVGGKPVFSEPEKIQAYLSAHKGGLTTDNPIHLSVNINLRDMTQKDAGWQQLLGIINAAGKYVALDLSGSTMPDPMFNPDASVAAGKDMIVSLVLPDAAIGIIARKSGAPAFAHFIKLKSVSAKNVTSVGVRAFSGLPNLQSVNFPNAETVGAAAFRDCPNLQNINVPEGASFVEDKFTDFRDGKTYYTIRMPDGKTWMAENLHYQTDNSWCYGNNASNCEKYGRLYTWNAAMSACPAGWRLPTRQDWTVLVSETGGDNAGTALKSSTPNWNGTDGFGFSALPGDVRWGDGRFWNVGSGGNWWTATEHGGDHAYYRNMNSGRAFVYEDADSKSHGFSVRCLRD